MTIRFSQNQEFLRRIPVPFFIPTLERKDQRTVTLQRTIIEIKTMPHRFALLSFLGLFAPSAVMGLVPPAQTASTSTRSSVSALAAVKEASFGMGCFWEPAEEMLKVDGVIDTISGYNGNKNFDNDPNKKVPSYDNVCFGREWVEGVRVIYDSDKISYKELLDEFFKAQKPQLGSRQYGSMIFPHDEEQLKIAKEWQSGAVIKRDDGFQNDWTEIEYPRTNFYSAEGYHQNYWQKQRPRFALILALLIIATGFGDQFYDPSLEETVKTFANGATVAVGLFVTAE